MRLQSRYDVGTAMRQTPDLLPFQLRISDVWTGSYKSRKPLAALDSDEHSHIHGRLELRFGERCVPHLGYWGPDDVCLGDWLEELGVLLGSLGSGDSGEHTFDEGEQGQPAFRFTREGDVLSISIVASAISGASADKDWQDVAVRWAEFDQAVRTAMEQFREQIASEATVCGAAWWSGLQRRVSARVGNSQ